MRSHRRGLRDCADVIENQALNLHRIHWQNFGQWKPRPWLLPVRHGKVINLPPARTIVLLTPRARDARTAPRSRGHELGGK
jgi:hypothetical protein